MKFAGGCHCGSIEIEFSTELTPSEIDVRACQCSFCRKHYSRAVSDPNGSAVISVRNSAQLVLYEFGLRTARYVLCGGCGVYVAAITNAEPMRAIVIVNSLRDHQRFTKPLRPADYDAERREERIARRRSNWTPAAIIGVEKRRKKFVPSPSQHLRSLQTEKEWSQ